MNAVAHLHTRLAYMSHSNPCVNHVTDDTFALCHHHQHNTAISHEYRVPYQHTGIVLFSKSNNQHVALVQRHLFLIQTKKDNQLCISAQQ